MGKVVMKRTIATFLMIAVILGAAVIPSADKKGKSEIDNLRKWYEEYQVNEAVAIDAEDGDGIAYAQATKYLGSVFWVVVKRSNGSIITCEASIGYRAKRNSDSKKGFVTCGHGLKLSKDNYVYSNSWTSSSGVFGKIEKSIFNSSCDASFVSVNSGTTISNQTHGRGGSKVTINPNVVKVKKGDKLYMCGSTSGVASAKVAWAYDSSWYYDPNSDQSMTVSNLICTPKMSSPGDSGAPVYKGVDGVYKLVGIIVAGDEYSTLIMDAGTINSKLKVTPY